MKDAILWIVLTICIFASLTAVLCTTIISNNDKIVRMAALGYEETQNVIHSGGYWVKSEKVNKVQP